MPLDKTTSRSLPAFPIPAEKPDEARKTASLTDLRGELRTPDGVHPFHLTEAEELPSAGVSTHGSRNSGAQLSDYHAELVSVSDAVQGERSSISSPSGNTSQAAALAQSLPVSPPGFSVTGYSQTLSQPDISSGHSVTSDVSATTVSEKVSSQVSSELIAEVKRLITGATPEQLKASEGELMKLPGIDESPHKAELVSKGQLLRMFLSAYKAQSKGGKNFPADFADKLIKDFEKKAMGSAKPKPTAPTGKSKATVAAKKANKLTLDQMPDLQNVFLTRAVNHLITGELHELDPIIGDEGCQMRTPFVLDMHRLVQQNMPVNAVASVDEYRAKTGDEQVEAFGRLKALELKRKDKDQSYESGVSEFISSDALKNSSDAKSGPYETMFTNLISSVEQHSPESVNYLGHVCSEGAIYWESVLDPFGLSVMPDQNPIFPNASLARRKMAQSRLSKKYMARSAAELLSMGGGTVSKGVKELGYDKKGVMQTSSSFLTAQSKKDSMPAMLLHAVQMHSGAAVTRGERLELLPYWETTRLALTHALKKNYPLIVNLRRLTVSGEDNDRRYSSNICQTLFYEPTDQGYKYQPNPSEAQRTQGALLFQGFSMLRKGDTGIPGATLPTAPWVFEEDPEEFLDGFTKCDVANLMLLGDVGTHHPLNTGGPGSGAYAYGLPGDPAASEYKFEHDPGGWKYVDAIHDLTLSDLGQPGMTQRGMEYLTPEFELTGKSKGLVFPDQCPVNITDTASAFNIKEEYQLMKLLCQAAGMKDTMYAKHDRQTKTAERVAQSTMPFVSTHILASTFAHENEVSSRFSPPKTRGVSENLDELRKK